MKNNIVKISAIMAILGLFIGIAPVLAQGNLSVSQTNINLNVGQNTTLTVFPPSGQIVNVTSISNTFVAFANISNNIVTVYGLANGTTQIQLGTFDNFTATIFVTVGGNNNSGNISFGQDNVSLNIGQTTSVSIFNNNNFNNSYFISNNTNSGVVSASISGSTINLTGLNSGSSSITVSSNQNSNNFATLFVTVTGNNNSGTISLSQNNVSLNVGQSASVSIFSNNSNFNSYFISNNSNSNVVSAFISGSTINLNGLNTGSSSITISSNQNTNNFATLFVTVGSNNNGTLSFSQNNVSMNVGQTVAVDVFNNTGSLFISSNSINSIASVTVSNNRLTIFGNSIGSTSFVVTSSNNQSGTIFVTVGGNNNGNGTISFSQNNVSLNIGQSASVSIFSNNNFNNSYFISNNSNSNVVSAGISGRTINLTGLNSGSSSITVSSNQNSNNFATLFVTVGGNNNSGNLLFTNISPSQAVVGQFYSFSLQVSGGNSPYNFSMYSGSLPSGLVLSSNGNISGTPTSTGNFSFAVRVNDSFNRSLVSGTLNINVINSGTVAGTSIFANGTLLNDNGTIYILYKNTKTGFGNLAAFKGLGYKLGNVIPGSDPNLINSGLVIGSANMAHPWGSWIKSGSTVYFVHDQGLIPISSHVVFLNNGGRDNLVVAANIHDFSKPILEIMNNGDQRLR